jgi:hypothetical protein
MVWAELGYRGAHAQYSNKASSVLDFWPLSCTVGLGCLPGSAIQLAHILSISRKKIGHMGNTAVIHMNMRTSSNMR